MKKEIDFYSFKGKNVNSHLGLNVVDNQYYSWEEVKQLYDQLPEERRESLKQEIVKMEMIVDGRKIREFMLKTELKKKEVELIKHSYLVRNFVMYSRGNLQEIVNKMTMMKTLFEKCNIKEKWENHKVGGKSIYTFEEKDKFYEKVYEEYCANN